MGGGAVQGPSSPSEAMLPVGPAVTGFPSASVSSEEHSAFGVKVSRGGVCGRRLPHAQATLNHSEALPEEGHTHTHRQSQDPPCTGHHADTLLR